MLLIKGRCESSLTPLLSSPTFTEGGSPYETHHSASGHHDPNRVGGKRGWLWPSPRSAAPPLSSCPYSPECVEGKFCEVRIDGALRGYCADRNLKLLARLVEARLRTLRRAAAKGEAILQRV
jgi:hypothetical protein